MRNRKKKQKAAGLTIGEARIVSGKRAQIVRYFSCLFLVMLGSLGAFGSFYTGFSLSFPPACVTGTVTAVSVIFTFFFFARKNRLACLAAVLVVFVWTGYLLRDSLRQGILFIFNDIIQVYVDNSNFDMMPVMTGLASEVETARICAIAASYVMAVLAFLLVVFLTARRKRYLLCITATIPFFGASLVVGKIPDYRWMALLFIFWALLVCDGVSLRGTAAAVLTAVFAVTLLCIGLVFPEKNYERSGMVENLRLGILDGADISAIFRGGGIAGMTSRVNLQSSGDLSFTGKTMLKVKTAKKDIDYLKGFVGSVYTGQTWEELPAEKYEELEEIMGDKKVQNLPYWFSRLLDCGEDYEVYAYDLTVHNVGTNPRCIYVPYGLINLPEELSPMEFIGDMGLRSGNSLFGTQYYRIQAQTFSGQHLYMSLYNRILSRYLQTEMRNGVEFNDLGLGIMQESLEEGGESWPLEKWNVTEPILSIMTPEQQGFVWSAQKYRDFVYDTYTEVPEGLEAFLDEYREANGLTAENYPYPRAFADAVVYQVQSVNTYTLTPGLTPEGKDFVQYFLTENHQGYCRHFASAAALLLRSAGVPARYVEGYAVSPEAETDEDGWIRLPDSSAHAWVEIYVSGMGWIPVETTGAVREDIRFLAGIEDVPEETEPGTETPEETEIPEDTTSAQDGRDRQTENEKDKDNPSGVGGARLAVMAAAGIAFAATAAAAGLELNRRLRLRMRMKRFRQKNRSRAALSVYAYIMGLVSTGGGSGKEEPLSIPDEIHGLAAKARFSQHRITEEELQELLKYAETLRTESEERLSGIRRIHAKFIRGLF
ncbi:transglutaminase family protein [Qiania dongpingensis]|uniref:Transglutaminase domain-containing protein n=1 Tax=Qiania dongpingensis TaxID=2763669 RepID=A0A7G9G0T6_9FIRM|nr:transglutaminase domain-containing protein [Qiania dongpingensis]QNM04418.1 transglutaminase domain-containing protein [Qiania dongpingensis]